MNRRHDRRRHWIAILWPSFVAAGVFAGIFFAFVDPLVLANELALESSPRLAGYSCTFLFLWALGAISAYAAQGVLRAPEPNAPPTHTMSGGNDESG